MKKNKCWKAGGRNIQICTSWSVAVRKILNRARKKAHCKLLLTSLLFKFGMQPTTVMIIKLLRDEIIRKKQQNKETSDNSISLYAAEQNKVLKGSSSSFNQV